MAAVTDPLFVEWMNETVTVKPASGTSDRYGRRSTGTPVSVQCYADERTGHSHTAEGYTQVQQTVLYCASDTIKATDIITYRGDDREVASVFTVRDENGAVSHQEIGLA